MKLKGKTAIITGGSIGIGAAIGELFAAEGASVALIARSAVDGQVTCDKILKAGGKAKFYTGDVSKSDSINPVLDKILFDFPKIDILVNNAGIWRPGKVTDLNEETWDSVIDTNLKGMFLVSKKVLPGMIERNEGVVINVASVAGMIGAREASAYGASKGGIINLSRCMALDYAPFNIRVNCLAPGMTETAQGIDVVAYNKPGKDQYDEKKNWQPLKKVCMPEDVAKSALYMASDDSSMMTGSLVVLDGGLTAE